VSLRPDSAQHRKNGVVGDNFSAGPRTLGYWRSFIPLPFGAAVGPKHRATRYEVLPTSIGSIAGGCVAGRLGGRYVGGRAVRNYLVRHQRSPAERSFEVVTREQGCGA
jgi:hypothetical protein